MDFPRDQEQLQVAIGYHFRDQGCLGEALTHSSSAHEAKGRSGRDNERLEFLGDAVLGLAAALHLGERFPHAEEGELSRVRSLLVGEKWLAAAARRLGLGDFLRLGRGEDRSGGREKRSVLSGAVEALVGAVFKDGGWEPAYHLALQLFEDALIPEEIRHRAMDAKTRLQEVCQERFQETPAYRLLDQSGPAHEPLFTMAVTLGERVLAEGRGTSKKEAEQEAAAFALEGILEDAGEKGAGRTQGVR